MSILMLGLLLFPSSSSFGRRAANSTDSVYRFHWIVPLGIEGITLQPANRTFYLMGSAESPLFEGWQRIETAEHSVGVMDAEGHRVWFYPDNVVFRITASGREEKMADVDETPVRSDASISDFILDLRFRVKVFHGLTATTLRPEAVKLIGVPADTPSLERIYRVWVNLPHVPLEDRVVLEVLSPAGERICKFHLDLY